MRVTLSFSRVTRRASVNSLLGVATVEEGNVAAAGALVELVDFELADFELGVETVLVRLLAGAGVPLRSLTYWSHWSLYGVPMVEVTYEKACE
jgi:hypothetical protein